MFKSRRAVGRGTLERVSTLVNFDQLLRHNVVVGAGTILAGLLGVAFQSLVSHQLRPSDYGAVFAVLAVITLIGLPAAAFTLLMARETSRDRASGDEALSTALLRKGNHALLLLGMLVGGCMAAGALSLERLFAVPAELWWAASVGLPFAMAGPLLLGELQGQQRFTELTALTAGQAGLKLVAAVSLGLVFGSVGVVAGLSIATLATYAIAWRLLRPKLALRSAHPWWASARAYLGVVLPSTLALAVLLSSDVLLVKHFFPSQLAGEYSAVAALGRAVFWGSSAVAAVLFPKLAFRNTLGSPGRRLVFGSLVLVVLGGLGGFAVLSLTARWIVPAFAGHAYLSASTYLPWYAVAMTLLGASAVLIATHQSRGRPTFLAVLIPLTVAEPILIVLLHQTLQQVIAVVLASMASVTLGLAIIYLVEERAYTRVGRVTAVPAIAMPTNR